MIEVTGFISPAAGVIVTSPAMTPEAAPSEVGCPSRIRSSEIQPSIPTHAATVVFSHARPATPSAANAEPPLKPNQPNHSSAAPSMTSGRLCGRCWLPSMDLRLPTIIASTKAAVPAAMCTTVPPAKSIGAMSASPSAVPNSFADSPSAEWLSRPPPQTMKAIGKYTSVVQKPTKINQVENFTRSASAPEISATEIEQNVSWNPMSMMFGYPFAPAM